MNKIVKLVIQAVEYFLVVLFVFWIFRKIGIKTDSSMIALAIGSTIGWAIIKVGKSIMKRKQIND
ncbi:hypothetical protein LL033_25740 (plasmid) [Clostridium estertheticum]|uniref:hypothetical protein n=1 Tax=Clostridium estertheticum TaxID=238834 RepID=UPI001C0C64FB|nr:hypothetical protein [Clostridium estertheticum]MBU3217386.1 hypothetical protein [Clostridium estertheticum]WAG58162.1 hypothetical protein LL033_25740 [Clostridium estertheticum]